MSERQETIADIIAEMRGMGNYQRYSGDHARVLAGRLEAAHKRERGDAAKLREALSDACYAMFNFLKTQNGGYEEMANALDKARAALAEPPRNCDVGSVAEQKERFKDFCKEGKLSRIDLGAYCAYDCPCRDSYDCKLEWAQMHYEEGGAK